MEIKDTLNKPYNDEERMSFIVRNNHQQGFEIRETDTALEAWGKSEEEISKLLNKQLIEQKKLELTKLDLESIRPSRAIQNGTASEFDIQKLIDLEEKAKKLREEIQQLEY